MRTTILIPCVILAMSAIACNTGNKSLEDEEGDIKTLTPVTVTSIITGPLTDTVQLNATSSFLLKTDVKAAIDGYIQDVNIRLGEKVTRGQTLFSIRSKEANTIGNIINNIDTSFHFSGLTDVKSPGNGFVTQLDHLSGDYVQEGESLVVISNTNSLVFMLNLPYELRPFLPNNKKITLSLPDGQKIPGTISSSLPYVDPESQIQNYIIYMDKYQQVPEYLIAKVNFIRNTKPNTISLPTEAVLTNEQQTEFWIMKMIDSTTAVKVPVVKGMETSGRVEILSPVLNPADIILLTGNYGLPDTSQVVIENNR